MSTGNQNLDLLIKLLMMTTSPNDSEALLAIRKANAQLERFHTSWEQFVKQRITVAADPFAQPLSQSQPQEAPPAARPAPTAAPRPSPSTFQAPPSSRGGRKPTPQPQPTVYSQPSPQPQSEYDYPTGAPRPNIHPGYCYDCQRKLEKDDGILWRKSNKTGKWHLRCAPGFGCQVASYQQRGRRPKTSAEVIDDLLS